MRGARSGNFLRNWITQSHNNYLINCEVVQLTFFILPRLFSCVEIHQVFTPFFFINLRHFRLFIPSLETKLFRHVLEQVFNVQNLKWAIFLKMFGNPNWYVKIVLSFMKSQNVKYKSRQCFNISFKILINEVRICVIMKFYVEKLRKSSAK